MSPKSSLTVDICTCSAESTKIAEWIPSQQKDLAAVKSSLARRFILSASPQCGKTGTFLYFITLLQAKYCSSKTAVPTAATPVPPAAALSAEDLESAYSFLTEQNDLWDKAEVAQLKDMITKDIHTKVSSPSSYASNCFGSAFHRPPRRRVSVVLLDHSL